MIKLKKQVSKKKLLHFFKTNQCVLFFHYNGDTKLYSSFIKQKVHSQFKVHSLFIKNKIADMFLTDLFFLKQNKEKLPLQKPREEFPIDRVDIRDQLDENIFKYKVVEENYLSLFKGPTILLGFENLENMQKVYNLCKNENFIFCIAAFYDMTILNHLQVERLAKLSNDSFLYSKLLNISNQPLNQIVNLSRNCFNLHLLNSIKMRAIALLKLRMQQLSEKKVPSL